MTRLPIADLRDEVVRACRTHKRLIIQAPTGSGKSTQIPAFLLDAGLLGQGKAIVLQPRRLATRLLATRVARERRTPLGQEVGYQIRFEDVSSRGTRIKYETEGILLRQLLSDPQLSDVNVIVFDEFHERHLYADITLARAMQLQQSARPDLLIVVMSATLDTAPLQTYLDPCAVLSSEGRTFPVEIKYLPRSIQSRDEHITDAAVEAVADCIHSNLPGDILIFMPGAYEIQRTINALRNAAIERNTLILPLHGELAPRDQDAAVASYAQRKIIVSTNVAETSLTIDGIRIVIDSGLARIPRFDARRFINTLWVENISRASADQRAGRAGRTAPGVCIRLWTQREHEERALHTAPEIKRLDLSEALLTLKAAGTEDVSGLPWVEPPEPHALERATQLLIDLGALHGHTERITPLGRRMAAFPLHPRYSRMLIAAAQHDCVRPVTLIAALTQGRSILERRVSRSAQEQRMDLLGGHVPSDFIILMRAWQYAASNGFDINRCRKIGVHAQAARQVQRVFDAFLSVAERQGLPLSKQPAEDDDLCKCVLTGFSDQVAIRRDSGTLHCQLVHGRKGTLIRESAIKEAPLFVASEIDEVQSGAQSQVLLRLATRIERNWLNELFPDAIQQDEHLYYDTRTKRVVLEQRMRYHDLILETTPSESPTDDAAARILASEIQGGRLTLNKWDQQIEAWIRRVNCLAAWCPEFELPAIGEEERTLLIQQLCLGCHSYRDVRNQPVWPVLKALLNEGQLRLVDQHAPDRINAGAQRLFRLVYAEQAAPYFSARIQELFGLTTIPTIALGRVTPLVHILAPNQRPVQITADLPAFWRDHYPRIRQELKRKYPKHAWPEKGG